MPEIVYNFTSFSEVVGTTNVILYTDTNSDGKEEFFRAFPITVKAERKIDHVEWTIPNQKINAYTGATSTVYATVYDQYNEFFTAADLTKVSVEWNNKSAVEVAVIGTSDVNAWNDTLKINVSKTFEIGYVDKAETDKPKNAIIVCNGNGTKVNKTLSVSYEEAINNVKFDCSAAALDTGLTKSTSGATAKTAELQLKTTGKNGFDIGTMNFTQITADPQKAVSAGAVGLTIAQAKDGIYLVRAQYKAANADAVELAAGANVAIAANKITLTNIVSGNKLAKGDYNFTFYKYQCADDGKTKVATVIARQTVKVTDTDAPITVKVLSDKTTATTSYDETNAPANFEVKFDGEAITAITDVVTEISDTAVYVKSIKFTAPTAIFGPQTFEVNVNKLLKK